MYKEGNKGRTTVVLFSLEYHDIINDSIYYVFLDEIEDG
jgi:hypothetical protein